MARGMTIREICDYYGIEFNLLSENDKFFLCSMYLKGRVTGTYKATAALFRVMEEKGNASNAQNAALAYLMQFSKKWEGAGEKGKLPGAPKAIKIEVIGNNE